MPGYTAIDAGQMADVLNQAAEASCVAAIKYELSRRSREWADTAEGLGDVGDRGEVSLLGAVMPGMYVYYPTARSDDPWLYVVRTMNQWGQHTLHLDDRGSPVYINLHSASSPLVVKS